MAALKPSEIYTATPPQSRWSLGTWRQQHHQGLEALMVTTWTYQLGSSTSCVLTEFVTSSRTRNIPRIPRIHWIIHVSLRYKHNCFARINTQTTKFKNMAKACKPFSLDRLSGTGTVQSTVFLILDIFLCFHLCAVPSFYQSICENSTPIPCLSLFTLPPLIAGFCPLILCK